MLYNTTAKIILECFKILKERIMSLKKLHSFLFSLTNKYFEHRNIKML